ncbi:TPM domain-containing protein [Ramlibacter sp. PS4R-6]|uniref:TPM domain-containing protein n=1 Tax=Ramlibacter sp. PS4R-6 TaxID=3133438 RepID=UPI0030AD0B5B
MGWTQRIARLLRHRLRDERDTRRAIPRQLVERLTQRVADSERRHTGEIRICVEASLPTSYVLRDATPRERAVAMFGKLRVWDTEANNGVLVYLLLVEHAIEIVADRGLTARVPEGEWQRIVDAMRAAFQARRYEEGLQQALDAVTALLVQHFPAASGAPNPNELPDEPSLN